MLAYWKDIVWPLIRGFPSLTRQSSKCRRLNIRGLIRRAELNQPQLRWIPEMSQPETQTFIISTVYVGIPLGRGAVGPWFITISDFEHLSPHIRVVSTSFPAPKGNCTIMSKSNQTAIADLSLVLFQVVGCFLFSYQMLGWVWHWNLSIDGCNK